MATLRFNSFEHLVNGAVAPSSYGLGVVAPSLDRHWKYVNPTDDAVFSLPLVSLPFYIYYAIGVQSGTTAFGRSVASAATNVPAAVGCCQSIALPRADVGSPTEVWVTLDWQIPIPDSTKVVNATSGSSDLRTEARHCVFAWGDLRLVFQGLTNFQTGPDRWDVNFDLYNGSTKLGSVTLYNTDGHWAFIKVHAKLDGSTGAFDATVDGVNAAYTGLNSVATTALVDATHIYVGCGVIGKLSGSGIVITTFIDNVFFSDAGFPSGRPVTQRVTLASDYSVTGWAAGGVGATTVAAALNPTTTPYARGPGVGNKAHLTPTAPSTSGWLTDIIGWQFQLVGVSNVDLDATKKIKAGITLSGTTVYGSLATAAIPPATPSRIDVPLESIFYKTGTTPYALTDVSNCKFTLEVAS